MCIRDRTAAFLGMDADSLRASIEHGGCPFGLGWQKDIRGNRAFKIPTATFYLWYCLLYTSVASPVPQRLRESNEHNTQCLVKIAAHHMALFVSDRANKREVFFGKLSKL